MPLPSDEQLIKTAEEILSLFQKAFGPHPGFRPAHAKGQLLSGTFKPTKAAKELSKAPHFQGDSVPVLVRFSNSTGLPEIPDTDGNSQPSGIALRFDLGTKDGKRWHTDIIGHSTPHFPVRTGKEFGEFLGAVVGGKAEEFVGSHPAAKTFVTAPKPFPVSFGTQEYFALNAYRFVNADGKETYVRYRIVPEGGKQTIEDVEAKQKSDNYLFEEVLARVKKGSIAFKLVAQIAEQGDPTDDVTQQWPEDRKLVELGSFQLEKPVEDNGKEQKYAIFDPIPRVEGIEPSADPLLEFRAGLYLISGRKRRAA